MSRRPKRFRKGTVYVLRVRRTGWTAWFLWWPAIGYIGQTRYADYRKRIDQHLYGCWWDGEWNPPKYWAHLVVDYYPLWASGRWSDWGLDAREFLCIRVFLPIHNVLLNVGNPRRVIPPPKHERIYPTPGQITAVERRPSRRPHQPVIPAWPADTPGPGVVPIRRAPVRIKRPVPRSSQLPLEGVTMPPMLVQPSIGIRVATGRAGFSYLRRSFVLTALTGILAGLGWLFWPGHVGWTTIAWSIANWRTLAMLLLLIGVSVVLAKHKPRRRRSSTRRRRRRSLL